jgi:hypothetical protein
VPNVQAAHENGPQIASARLGNGLEITSDSGSWTWGPTLTAYGYRGQERLVETPKSSAADVERVSYQWDSVLHEWYINGQPRCTLRIASQPSVRYAIERPSGENSGAQSSGADAHRRRARAM